MYEGITPGEHQERGGIALVALALGGTEPWEPCTVVALGVGMERRRST